MANKQRQRTWNNRIKDQVQLSRQCFSSCYYQRQIYMVWHIAKHLLISTFLDLYDLLTMATILSLLSSWCLRLLHLSCVTFHFIVHFARIGRALCSSAFLLAHYTKYPVLVDDSGLGEWTQTYPVRHFRKQKRTHWLNIGAPQMDRRKMISKRSIPEIVMEALFLSNGDWGNDHHRHIDS